MLERQPTSSSVRRESEQGAGECGLGASTRGEGEGGDSRGDGEGGGEGGHGGAQGRGVMWGMVYTRRRRARDIRRVAERAAGRVAGCLRSPRPRMARRHSVARRHLGLKIREFLLPGLLAGLLIYLVYWNNGN